ncbi:hypothetical protein C817_00664 [Dorea sp. 5-2]|nr:hypothetical protein C817_00664 [Dorea sp. 5-2]
MGYRIIHRGKMVKEIAMKEIAEITIADNAVFPVVLAVISFAFAVLSMYHVERKDLIG